MTVQTTTNTGIIPSFYSGMQLLSKPCVKETLIFGLFISLFLAGTIIPFIIPSPLSPLHLADHKVWIIDALSMASRVKSIAILVVCAVASGIGSMGLLSRTCSKILQCKEKVDADIANYDPLNSNDRKANGRRMWYLQKASRVINLLDAIRNLMHTNKWVKGANLGIALIAFFGGMAVVALSTYYFVSLSHIQTGVIGGISVSGLVVGQWPANLAVMGISRGAGMASGTAYLWAEDLFDNLLLRIRNRGKVEAQIVDEDDELVTDCEPNNDDIVEEDEDAVGGKAWNFVDLFAQSE